MLLVRGDHMGNEVKIGKLPGHGRLALGLATPRSSPPPAASPATSARWASRADMPLDRRPRGRRDGRFRLRRQRAGLPPARRQLRPRLPRAGPRRRHPQRRHRRPVARRPAARSTSSAASRSATCSRWATVYSQAMGATYLAADGQSKVLEMGCYGIGVTRVVAAAIEQNHDERGIIWPEPMAPFTVAIAPVGYDRNEAVRALADRLHDELAAAGVEVLLDDRGERPGVMFADLELIGIPHRITIGDRGLKEGRVEYQGRRDTRGHRQSPWTRSPASSAASWAPRSPGLNRMKRRIFWRIATAPRSSRPRWRSRRSPARAGAQAEEQLAPSVVAGSRPRRSPTRRCPPTTRTAPTCSRGSPRCRGAIAHKLRRRARAARAPRDRALRGDARGARSAARARRHLPRERLQEIRGLRRRRARLHAGDAVLGAPDRQRTTRTSSTCAPTCATAP